MSGTPRKLASREDQTEEGETGDCHEWLYALHVNTGGAQVP